MPFTKDEFGEQCEAERPGLKAALLAVIAELDALLDVGDVEEMEARLRFSSPFMEADHRGLAAAATTTVNSVRMMLKSRIEALRRRQAEQRDAAARSERFHNPGKFLRQPDPGLAEQAARTFLPDESSGR